MERDTGEGDERKPGTGAEVYGAKDAGERDRADDKKRADPPPQELREARLGPQGSRGQNPVPGPCPQAEDHPPQESQGSMRPAPEYVFKKFYAVHNTSFGL